MNKLLLLAVATAALIISVATPLKAQEVDECTCGVDEEGMCLPCDEE